METPLRKAPDVFFDQQLWKLFQSYFEPPELAIERISVLPEMPGYWYHRETDSNFPRQEEARWRLAQETADLGRAILWGLQRQLLEGQITATGVKFGYNREKRVAIPPERWLRLWPDFANNFAMAQLDLKDPLCHRYDEVRLTSDDASLVRAVILQDCISFLKQRRAAGVEQRKVLISEIKGFFGQPIPIRIFNEAYTAVFNKRRGHPRLTRK
jgi:hypothetical protein